MASFGTSDLKQGYGMAVDAIIRPPRRQYNEYELGSKCFQVGSRTFQRTDTTLTNKRGLKIVCSHFEPIKGERVRKALPCVIYCHGNCGCRVDALQLLRYLLPYNITLFCFDFSGCGLSEGEYISLGYFEKYDLAAIVEHLRKTNTVSRIALWGRSMGAATSLLYAEMDPSIACMVVDSPFSSLTTVARELVETSQVNVPGMLVSMGLRMIRKSIKNKAGFDINKLEPIKRVGKAFVPVLFAHGKSDNFILPHHSQDMMKKYAGDKNLLLVEGDHNSQRPQFFIDSVSIFLNNHLLVGEDKFDQETYDACTKGVSTSGSSSMLYKAAGGFDGADYSAFGGGGDDDDAILQQVLAMSLETTKDQSTTTTNDDDDMDADLKAALELSMKDANQIVIDGSDDDK